MVLRRIWNERVEKSERRHVSCTGRRETAELLKNTEECAVFLRPGLSGVWI